MRLLNVVCLSKYNFWVGVWEAGVGLGIGFLIFLGLFGWILSFFGVKFNFFGLGGMLFLADFEVVFGLVFVVRLLNYAYSEVLINFWLIFAIFFGFFSSRFWWVFWLFDGLIGSELVHIWPIEMIYDKFYHFYPMDELVGLFTPFLIFGFGDEK